MATMDGILEGVNTHSACAEVPGFVAMSRLDLLLVNLDGDLFDLTVAYPASGSSDSNTTGPGLCHFSGVDVGFETLRFRGWTPPYSCI
jgi:hypothetical protein